MKNINIYDIWVTPLQWEVGEIKVGEEVVNLPPTSEKTQGHLRHRRKIAYTKSGGKVFYRLQDILDYLERNRAVAVA